MEKFQTPREIETAVLDFIAKFTALPTQTERIKKADALRKELLEKYENTTVRNYFTRYRKAIKALSIYEIPAPRNKTKGYTVTEKERNESIKKPLNEVLAKLILPKRASAKIKNVYQNDLVLRMQGGDSALIPVSLGKANEAVERARAYINAPKEEQKKYKTLAALALVTGRRTAEIALSGQFLPVKGNEYAAIFSGQLKKKASEKDKNKPYKIPLLAPFSEVQKGLSFVRDWLALGDTATPDTVNRRLSKDLGDCVKLHFADVLENENAPAEFVGEKAAPHDLRKLYTAILYDKNNKQQKGVSFALYAAQILGHAAADKGIDLVAFAYRKYSITKD